MDAVWQALISEVLVPLIVALVAAIGAWIVTKLPGPLRDWLQSGTHQRDLELVLGAMARRAADAVATGKRIDVANDIVDYARAQLPEVIAKLRPKDEALVTMARAAVQKALANQAQITAGAGAARVP